MAIEQYQQEAAAPPPDRSETPDIPLLDRSETPDITQEISPSAYERIDALTRRGLDAVQRPVDVGHTSCEEQEPPSFRSPLGHSTPISFRGDVSPDLITPGTMGSAAMRELEQIESRTVNPPSRTLNEMSEDWLFTQTPSTPVPFALPDGLSKRADDSQDFWVGETTDREVCDNQPEQSDLSDEEESEYEAYEAIRNDMKLHPCIDAGEDIFLASGKPPTPPAKALLASFKPMAARSHLEEVIIESHPIRKGDMELGVRGQFLKLGLPDEIAETYMSSGISGLYPWQAECLNRHRVVSKNSNFIYTAPTSAGKTMVAELLLLKKVLTGKKAIFVVPYVAIAVEKANSLVYKLIKEQELDTLGVMVVDELHQIGEGHRGYLLEQLINKVKFCKNDEIQIIGMSATIPSIERLAKWLDDAEVYESAFRPVPLVEYMCVGNEVRDVAKDEVREPRLDSKRNTLVQLVEEVVLLGKSVLVFCGSQDNCRKRAKQLAAEVKGPVDARTRDQREESLLELRKTMGGLDADLEYTVRAGIAFHHGGLTTEEREILEDAFRAGVINTLVATSTLASGVNLPARRVIIADLTMGVNPLSALEYRQMRGRAGRKGQDTLGESIVMCSDTHLEKTRAANMMCETVTTTASWVDGPRGIKRAVLELIASGSARTRADLRRYAQGTVLNALSNDGGLRLNPDVNQALNELGQEQFIQVIRSNDAIAGSDVVNRETFDPVDTGMDDVAFAATHLGRATASSNLAPDDAAILYNDLRTGRRNLVLEGELHVVYHVTPPFIQDKINVQKPEQRQRLLQCWGRDWESDNLVSLVGRAVGITEKTYEFLKYNQAISERTVAGKQQLRILKRFYLALILHDLILEKPFSYVSKVYDVGRATLQQLQTLAATFAGMVKIFCVELNWHPMARLVADFSDRLSFGVHDELLQLVKIPLMTGKRARSLWNAGYTTVASIACCTVDEILSVFEKEKPFIKDNSDDPEILYKQQMEYRELQQITEAALSMVTEAELTAARGNQIAAARGKVAASPARISPPARRGLNGKGSATKSGSSTDQRRQFQGNFQKAAYGTGTLNRCSFPIAPDKTPCPPPRALRPSALMSPASKANLFDGESCADDYVIVTENARIFEVFIRDWEASAACVLHPLMKSNAWGVQLMGVAVCMRGDEVFYIDLTRISDKQMGDIKRILSRTDMVVTCFDTKRFVRSLYVNGIHPRGAFEDPKVAAWCLDPERKRVDLVHLMKEFFPMESKDRSGTDIQRCAGEVLQVKQLMAKLGTRLEREGMLEHFARIEMPVQVLLAEMEFHGVGFHHPEFHAYRKLFLESMKDLERQAAEAAGEAFSLTSPEHVAAILYDKLKLLSEDSKPKTSKPGEKGAEESKPRRSTKKGVLMKVVGKHPLPGIIMEHRRLAKLFSTHLVPLSAAAKASDEHGMKRIHCSYTTHTATGRVNTHDPNLQNIPHPRNVTAAGLDINSANLRNAFRAAPGTVLLAADYCQLELRLFAQYSFDEKLLEILNKKDSDIFRLMALYMTDKADIRQVTHEERQKAKGVCYGVLYGQSIKSVAEDLETSVEAAEKFVTKFNSLFPKIDTFKNKITTNCAKTAAVTTLLGRKRYLPAIKSKSMSEKGRAERQAINTTIQGSAADLVKTVMLKVSEAFKDRWGHEDDSLRRPRIVLQVHDELVFEVPLGKEDDVMVSENVPCL
ncbi:hypothetical protein HDV00_011480 [Rhizophlyctis rosea]|nr:hypothetical protein HDV00_011480 [Rhizophlyctis rosea]